MFSCFKWWNTFLIGSRIYSLEERYAQYYRKIATQNSTYTQTTPNTTEISCASINHATNKLDEAELLE